MEVVALRWQQLNQALKTLDRGMCLLDTVKYNSEIYLLFRDGVIQRFEYSIESLWKFLKIYLEINKKMIVQGTSSRSVLRSALKQNLLTQKEYAVLLLCIADRNLTSHTYNEEIAEAIHSQIPMYYQTMTIIAERLQQKMK